MPKRSASSTTMTVASGTSTPTSMTVVATRTWISPLRKRSMTPSLSDAFNWPCNSPRRRPASTVDSSRARSSVADLAWTRSDPSTNGHTT